jgi:tRNA (Thr-GGU) A37 N-methylase
MNVTQSLKELPTIQFFFQEIIVTKEDHMGYRDVGLGITVGILFTMLYNVWKVERKEKPMDTNSEDVHEHCRRKIQAERVGRINAEKALRAGVVEKISDPSIGYPLLVIGNVSSPYRARRGTPRQGLLVPDSRSLIRLSSEIPEETLHGLEGYSHMFVQFLFHENTNLVKTLLQPGALSNETTAALNSRTSSSKSSTFTKRVHSFASKVLPPLLYGGSIGVFASRSPHRPNAIGLSLVRIISVDPSSRTIVVSGADLVNGTPVVDLKPWGPFDCPTCLHNTVDHQGIVSCIGKGDRCESFSARVPEWVDYGLKHPYVLPIEWSSEANADLNHILETGSSIFYQKEESEALRNAINQMLGLDIRSVHQGRGGTSDVKRATELIGDRIRDTDLPGQSYEVEYDVFHILFRVINGNHPVHSKIPWIQIDRINTSTLQ